MSIAGSVTATAATRPSAVATRREWAPVILFAVATVLAGYLAALSLSGGAAAGCGVASPCQRVLQSRWAYWLGVPVSIPAVLAYGALLLGAWRRRDTPVAAAPTPRWMIVLCVIVVTAALWFVFLQAVVLEAFCPLCLATHVAATSGAAVVGARVIRGGRDLVGHLFAAAVAATVGLPVLFFGQLLVSPRLHTVSATPGAQAPVRAAGERVLRLYDGQFEIDLGAFPALGPASAPNVAICLFDYTCSHCRATHTALEQAQRRFGDRLAIVLLPVPLDARCNHLVTQTAAENLDACDYAKLGLAVWQANSSAFAAFHQAVFGPARPPGVDVARAAAERLVGREPLRRALENPQLDRQLRLAVDLFAVNSRRAGASQLPQLMLRKSVSVGAIHDADTLLAMLRDAYGESATH